MAVVADHYMVEHFDFQKLASADEVAGNFDVGFGGRGLALGVIVHEHEGGGGGDDGQPEDGQRMD